MKRKCYIQYEDYEQYGEYKRCENFMQSVELNMKSMADIKLITNTKSILLKILSILLITMCILSLSGTCVQANSVEYQDKIAVIAFE